MNVTEHSGNIFNSEAQAIVVTVNCVGYMGKGMALECALRYPNVETEYKALCDSGGLSIGHLAWSQLPNGNYLVLFPTKDDYKFPSKYSYIEASLEPLATECLSKGLSSIAVPRLGSELGGLDWDRVRPMILGSFEGIKIDLELWAFGPQISDPLMTSLTNRLSNNPDNAMRSTGVNLDQIEALKSLIGRNNSATAVDLLSIQGLGKTKIKKLIKWAQDSQAEPEPTLFDLT